LRKAKFQRLLERIPRLNMNTRSVEIKAHEAVDDLLVI
jgi:hypothetical protein